ncbi:porin [Burkholderia lata]|uniref:Porin n=2 Tax=Burkholderia lata (strain ATCC 17760 / DSM 23089 / LMG 22485 / NCIMB 9086 / R18194 / 383) TaxID=482957 RepID=A0A6P3CCV7_BURL3|nr:porin [Burkholderia lata]VWB30951.1 porin [Burkholderia lata]VWL87402.1 porin [Burkholderia lata]
MKKSGIAIASSLMAVVSIGAHAQSSVTLYGTIDDGVNYVSNEKGAKAVQMVSGTAPGNRLGFKGSEDLGGGMRAIFTIENGYDSNTGKLGQGGLMFGRQAFVGLSSDYGTVTLGRQYDELSGEYLGLLEAGDNFTGYLGAHAADVDNLNDTYRINNSIKYMTPDYHGFSAAALYGFGGVAGDMAANRVISVGASYHQGGFSAAAAYEKVNNPGVAVLGATSNPSPNAAFTTALTTPIWGGYQSAGKLQIYGAGLGYTFGNATARFVYTNTRFEQIAQTLNTPYLGQAVFHNYEANIEYRFTPAVDVGLGYTYTDAPRAKYQQINFAAQYFLSKRTSLYAIAVYQHASGIDSYGQSAVAQINEVTASSTPNQLLVRAGLSVKF